MADATPDQRAVAAWAPRRSLLVEVSVRMVKEKPLATFGAFVVLILVLTGVLADVIARFGENEIHLADRMELPSLRYLLGTDQLGRDLFSRIVFGARISVIVGLSAAAIDTVVAAFIGIVSGYTGGKLDLVSQRFVDAWIAFPGLVIILTIMAVLGPGMWQIITVLGVSAGIRSSRVIRGATISVKENDYVQAAAAIGCSTLRLLMQHILPNVMAPIIIIFTLAVGGAILSEASLSFLGLGIPPPAPSWGGMLSQEGRQYMLQAPWLSLWPGLALSIVVYGVNVFGDGLRDLLDPRLRRGG
jgi:peptide/nickel transport system permease protein